MAIPIAFFTQEITINGREGEPSRVTTATRSGSYDPENDTFVFRALDAGAREIVIENASQTGSIRFGELGEPPQVESQ